jgi:hypothetical protein
VANRCGWAKRRSDRPDDEGAAIVEFIALSLLLLVPLTYLVVTLSRIQAGAFAAEGAAHEAARTAPRLRRPWRPEPVVLKRRLHS